MSFWHRVCYWGTRPDEIKSAWPCDSRAEPGEVSVYRAIDVDAPPDRVFRWLCQLKVAPYSYDWLDNAGRRSPDRLIEGVDHLAVGQRVMSIFKLVDFETNRFMTLETKGIGPFGPVTVTYQTLPGSDSDVDSTGTRLIARLRMAFPRNILGDATRIGLSFGDWIMMRKQFLTLKALAERELEENV